MNKNNFHQEIEKILLKGIENLKEGKILEAEKDVSMALCGLLALNLTKENVKKN